MKKNGERASKSFLPFYLDWEYIQKDSKDFYGNYGLLNNDNLFNMNAYLMSDNNDISIKVVVFDRNNKSVMFKRAEYGKKSLLVLISEVLERPG